MAWIALWDAESRRGEDFQTLADFAHFGANPVTLEEEQSSFRGEA
jgi:hypothetical protein